MDRSRLIDRDQHELSYQSNDRGLTMLQNYCCVPMNQDIEVYGLPMIIPGKAEKGNASSVANLELEHKKAKAVDQREAAGDGPRRPHASAVCRCGRHGPDHGCEG